MKPFPVYPPAKTWQQWREEMEHYSALCLEYVYMGYPEQARVCASRAAHAAYYI